MTIVEGAKNERKNLVWKFCDLNSEFIKEPDQLFAVYVTSL